MVFSLNLVGDKHKPGGKHYLCNTVVSDEVENGEEWGLDHLTFSLRLFIELAIVDFLGLGVFCERPRFGGATPTRGRFVSAAVIIPTNL